MTVGASDRLVMPGTRGFPFIKAHSSSHLSAPLPSWPLACWRRRRPQSGDQPQDVVEHLSRHRDLGHLEHDVATVADHLSADLDQLIPQTRQTPPLRCRWRRQGPHEVAEVVGQRMELKANRIGGEGTA